MYDSPVFMSLYEKISEFTTEQIQVFCERLCEFVYQSSGEPTYVTQALQEMVLPEPSVVNVSLEIYAQQILFLAAIEDLRRDGLLNKTLGPEDIHAADTFRESLLTQVYEFRSMTMSMYDILFYKRDIEPLLGATVRTQLLVPA